VWIQDGGPSALLLLSPAELCWAHAVLCCVRVQDATDLVARLRAFHHTAQSQPDKKGLSQCGLDLVQGKVRSGFNRIGSRWPGLTDDW